MAAQIIGFYFDNNGQVLFYVSLQELQHYMFSKYIFGIKKTFDMIYFFP